MKRSFAERMKKEVKYLTEVVWTCHVKILNRKLENLVMTDFVEGTRDENLVMTDFVEGWKCKMMRHGLSHTHRRTIKGSNTTTSIQHCPME